jgi:hypothetical protein
MIGSEPAKKRLRKTKAIESIDKSATQNIQIVIDDAEQEESSASSAVKKRGRKPKGGKLVVKQHEPIDKNVTISNVILHLKCSLKDLDDYNNNMNKMVTNPLSYNPDIPPSIMTYNPCETAASFSNYESQKNDNTLAYMETTGIKYRCSVCCKQMDSDEAADEIIVEQEDDNINIKDVNQKLKQLKMNLYKNSMQDKKSACFWCTYDFDNQACYIPKYEFDGEICGYGSFCRPECAVAYLMKENIDDSTKFERYHLLNQIYSKIYDFKKNIKPAPNPYYLLEKFYGNLSIQEYRKLLKTEHMLLVIDKPLTRILPELHEDTDDFITGIYGNGKGNSSQAGGVYKVKRQSEKQQGPTKNSIMRDKFGIAQ